MQNAEFRISLAIPCQVYGEVLELSPLYVSISYHGTVKPVESEYGAVSFTMTSTQEYQAIPCISHFGRSRDTYFFLLRS